VYSADQLWHQIYPQITQINTEIQNLNLRKSV
jgi:hypothetical protein